MKKFLNFATNTENGQKLFLTICAAITIGVVIGLILSVPMFWMGNEYESTWMNSIAPYFFYAFFGYGALIFFLFAPYMSYISSSEKYIGDGRGLMKGMAIFCSIVPGALIYSFVAEALAIPHGLHNILGMLAFGLLYNWTVKNIFRKQFSVAQTFIPLC